MLTPQTSEWFFPNSDPLTPNPELTTGAAVNSLTDKPLTFPLDVGAALDPPAPRAVFESVFFSRHPASGERTVSNSPFSESSLDDFILGTQDVTTGTRTLFSRWTLDPDATRSNGGADVLLGSGAEARDFDSEQDTLNSEFGIRNSEFSGDGGTGGGEDNSVLETPNSLRTGGRGDGETTLNSLSPLLPIADSLLPSLTPNPSLPLSFIANAGQTDPNVRFHVRGAGHTLFFTPNAIVLTTSERRGDDVASATVALNFVGANPTPAIAGTDPLSGVAHFFTGNDPSQWQTHLPTYGSLVYPQLYDGIDLAYSGSQGELKSEFVISPGADPALIQLSYDGITATRLRDDGALVLETPLGELVETAPFIYQDLDGRRVAVEGGYHLLGDGRVGFDVGAYDPAYPLVIDPVLEYSTYLGGSGLDRGLDIAVDGTGSAYIAGETASVDFPEAAFDGIDGTSGGIGSSSDAFVAKLSADGTRLDYVAYFGGSGFDSANALAVGSDGSVYLTGQTDSADFSTVAPRQPEFGGGSSDAFLAKLSADGSTLEYATYLGGTGSETGRGIAIDAAGNAYITGQTDSADLFSTTADSATDASGDLATDSSGDSATHLTTDAATESATDSTADASGDSATDTTTESATDSTIDSSGDSATDTSGDSIADSETDTTADPATANTVQPHFGGGTSDAFVAKFNAEGSTLAYATYLGGTGAEDGSDIAVDAAGNAYITGLTGSTDFSTLNALQPDFGGGTSDAFVAKLAADGSRFDFSTYLGGSGNDAGLGIAVDAARKAYITGETASTDFFTLNALQPEFGGGSSDAFITKLTTPGSDALYSTYFGGSGNDIGRAIAVDLIGSASIAGQTSSADFPALNPLPLTPGGGNSDAFVAQLNPLGTQPTYATRLGGSQEDIGLGIALDARGSAYLVGQTASADFPTASPLQSGWSGSADAFIAKLTKAEIPGDLDGDRDVDADDLDFILGVLNTPVSGVSDPRDLDGDGLITIADARKLILLFRDASDPAPTPPILTLQLDSDTGTFTTDRITFNPTLTGTVNDEEGIASLLAGLNGQPATFDIASDLQPDGSLLLTPERLAQINGGTLPDGNYTLQLQAADENGNTSNLVFDFVLDTTAPALTLDLAPAFDSEPIGDQKTTFETVTLQGQTEANLTVTLGETTTTETTTETTTTADASGQFAFPDISLLEGENAFAVSATDLAGNRGEFHQTVERVLPDVEPPDVEPPIIAASLANDTGDDDSDGITSDPTIAGTVTDASPIGVFRAGFGGNFTDVSASLQADGSFQFDRTQLETLLGNPLVDGSYTLQLVAEDEWGNVSETLEVSFTLQTPIVDTEPPIITTLLANDTGTFATDEITFDPTLVGTVNDESGIASLFAGLNGQPATFDIYSDLQPNGSLLLTPERLAQINGGILPDGNYTLQLQAADANGNTSNLTFNFVLDTTAPALTLDLAPAFDSEPIGDQKTTFETVTLSGQTEANLTVTLGETTETTATADASGQFAFPDIPLLEGENAFTVSATDVAGNRGEFHQTVERVLADTEPPIITTLLANDTGTFATDGITFDPTLVGTVNDESGIASLFAGLNGQPATFDIYSDLQPNGSLLLTPERLAQINGGILPDGNYTLQLQAADANGNTSNLTFNFVLDTTAPALTLDLAQEFDSEPIGDGKTTFETVTLQGQTEADLTVELGETTTTADASGQFAFPDIGLLEGENAFTVSATDLAGNRGESNQTIERVPEIEPPIVVLPDIVLQEERFFHVTGDRTFEIPVQPSVLSFTYSDLNFDTTDPNSINDAFEAALVDANGNSLVRTIAGSRDAFFNLTEGEAANLAPGVSIDGQTVKVSLAGVTPGTQAKLILRLVNNDGDTTTSVGIDDIVVIADGNAATPPGIAPHVPATGSDETPDFARLSDVSASFTAEYGQTSFNDQTDILYADLALRNAGQYSVDAPLIVAIAHLSDPSVRVVDADGITPEGLPYYRLSGLGLSGIEDEPLSPGESVEDNAPGEEDNALLPGEITASRSLAFFNPEGGQFTYDLVVLGELNQAPEFTSEAVETTLAGLPYVYEAQAVDANGDELTYSLLVGSNGITVDSQTGQVSWTPTAIEIGTHAIALQVADGRGGTDVQAFTLEVTGEVPNRPPLFTSTPVVDARINQPYFYDADATDPDRDPLTYSLIRGPEGLRVDPTTGVVEWTPPPVLALGDTVFGQIGLPGETHEFTVSGTISQRLYLDGLQAFNGWQFKLYSPSGLEVERENDLFTLTENGNYRVVVGGSGEQTGSYGFSLIDPYLLPETPFDTVISGQLGPGTEDDLFRFNGLDGQKLFFDRLNASGQLDWVLLDSGNQIIASDSSMNDMELYLPRDGEYLLALRGKSSFTDVVDYSFEIVTPDELTDSLLLGSNDTPNEMSGSIGEPGEEDFFTFAGSLGQRVYLDRLNPIDNGSLSLSLYSPSGNRVLGPQTFVSGHELAPVTLTEEGIYQVRIDGSGDDVGDYSFSLRDVDLATPIDLDLLQSGTLAPGEASHLYQFEVSEGQRLFIDYQDDSDNYSDRTRWVLYDSGNRQVDGVAYTGGHLEVVAVSSDTYTLAIEGDKEGVPVDYSFEVITPDTLTIPLALDTPISNAITEKGERDVFTFEGDLGQRIFLDVLEASNHNIDLVTPSGDKLLDDTFGASDESVFDRYLVRNHPLLQRRRGPFVLPEAGTYQILFDGDVGNTGSYGFQIVDVSNAPILPVETPVTQTIDPGSSIEFYQFEGSEGDRIYFDLDTTSGNLVSQVYGSSSQLIERVSPGQTDPEFVLPGDGTYYLMIRGESADPIDYTIQYTSTTAPPVPIGSNIPIDGTISKLGERDAYTFEGTLGQHVVFDAFAGNSNITVEIKNPSGNVVFNGNMGSDSNPFTLLENGTYNIEIDGKNATTGDYRFALRDSTLPLTLGIPLTGTLGGRETVLYEFDGTAGQLLNFDSLSAVTGGQWVLSAPDNRTLNSFNLGSDFTQSLPADGTYRLALRNTSDDGLTYNIQINDISPVPIVPTGLGQLYSGEISAAGEVDEYTFTANAGTLFYFDGLGGGSNLRASLERPDGTHLFSSSSVADDFGPYRLTQTGDYTLKVNSWWNATGNYEFKLVDLEASASDLAFDTLINTSLDPKASTVYKFAGTVGQQILFDSLDSSNSDVTARIIDPSGRQIASTNTNYNSGLQTLPFDGDYYLLLDSNNSGTVTVNFQLLDASKATPLALDTVISGNFGDSKRETVLYRFTGTEGEKLFVDRTVGGTPFGWQGNSKNTYAVYSADGQQMFSQYLLRDYELASLPNDGEYLLEISGNADANNDYELQIVIPDDDTQIIDVGEVITGDIVEAGQTNTYTFTGTENQRLIFDSLSQASSSNILSATIYSPSGQQIANDDFWSSEPGAFTLHENGTYRLVIDASNAHTDSYSFRLLDFADATEVSLDTSLSGSLGDSQRETHLYRFTGEEDQQVYFDRREGDSPNDYVLYAPDGHQLFSQLSQLSQQLDKDYHIAALPTDGEYVVAIRGNGSSNSNYSMNLVTPDGLTTEHTIGETIRGEIGEPGEVDYYTFTGHPGQILGLDSLFNSPNIFASLYAPSGKQFDSNGHQVWKSDVDNDAFFGKNTGYTAKLAILEESGTYTLFVDAPGDITGEYAFRFLDFDEATDTETDTEIFGDFGTSGLESRAYRFTATEGEKLYFDHRAGSFDYYFYDPYGNQILYQNRFARDRDFEGVTVEETGEYTLIVAGDGRSQNYEIEVVTPEFISTEYTIGNTAFGEISEAGEQDWYTFEGATGQQIFIDGLLDSNSAIKRTIYSPTGKAITPNSFNTLDRDSDFITLKETGTYRFAVDATSSNTGEYGFRLLDAADAEALDFNTPISGNFGENNREAQIYRFSGEEGDSIFFDTIEGDFSNTYTLYRANGEDLFSQFLNRDRNFVLPETGDYLLALAGNGSTNNTYTLEVVAPDSVTQTLQLGQTVTGTIGDAGQRNTYTFEGQIGQQLFLDVLASANNLGTEVYAPNGQKIIDLSTSQDSSPFTLTEEGTYRLVVDGTNTSSSNISYFYTGSYSFILNDLAAAPTLEFATPISGSVEPGNSVDLYQFDGTQGTTLNFDLAANQWNGANWVLYDPGNRAIATPAGNSPDFDVTLPSEGRYTLAIQGSSSNPVGYGFQVTDTSVDAVENTGFGVVESGSINSSGEVDRYTFTANAGTKALFDSQEISSSALRFRLVNPDGSYAINNGTISNDRNPENFKLHQTGEYAVEVYGVNGTGTGNYQFQLLELPSDLSSSSLIPLEVGTVTQGTLDPGRSARVYSFLGGTGQSIYFNGIEGNNVRTHLYAPNGSEILFPFASTASRDSGPYTLTQEGLYHLVLQGEQNSPANYEFQLLDFDGGRELNFNLPNSGTLESGLQNKLYQFTGEAGQTLFFDSHTSSSNDWKLYGPDNSLIRDRRLSNDFDVTLDRDGTYTLLLGGRSSSQLDYDFSVFSYDEDNRVDTIVPGTGENSSSNDDGGLGSFAVQLSVEDGLGGVGVQEYQIRLLPDPDNNAPVITSEPETLYGLNQEFYRYQIESVDPDADSLTYRLIDGPNGAYLNRNTGELLWLPESPVVDGSYDFTVEVDDSRGGTDTQTFSVGIHPALGTIQGSIWEDINANGYRDTTLVRGVSPDVLMVVDVSGSAGDRSIDWRTADVAHLDLDSLSVLDVEQATVLALMEQIAATGRGENTTVGIVYFSDIYSGIGPGEDPVPRNGADYIDMNPAEPGVQLYTTPLADNNNNGIVDIREVLNFDGRGGTNFTRPLQKAEDWITSLSGTSNLIFLSDGHGELDEQIVADLNALDVNIHAFGIGQTPGMEQLRKIDPNAIQVQSPSEAISIFSGWDDRYSSEPFMHHVKVYLDLNNNSHLDRDEPWQTTQPDTTESLFVENSIFQFSFDNLLPGTYTIRQEVPAGYTQTYPGSDGFVDTITVEGGEVYIHLFGNHKVEDLPNHDPRFIGLAPSDSLAVGETLSYQANATDPDADLLTYDLSLAPDGMVIDAETGKLVWQPTQEQIGTTSVIVRVRDDRGGVDLQYFELTVTPPNTAPTFTSVLSSNKPQVGKPFEYRAVAIDPDDDPITYELTTPPSGLTLDATSGILTWTPTNAQLGSYDITLKASDDKGGASTQTLNVTVVEPQPNTAPSITSIPRTVTRVGTPYLYQVAVEDPDGDPSLFTLVDAPEGVTLSESGLLSWQPTAAGIGSHAITLTVHDGQGGSDTQSYTLDVRHQAPNYAPQITSEPLYLTNIDRPYQYRATATDPDGDAVFWELVEAPEGMVLDPETGVVSWQPELNRVGDHTVTLQAIDPLGAFATQSFTLAVRGTNTPPQILSVPPTQIGIEQDYAYPIEATDPEGDALSFSLGAHPDGMTLDETTAAVAWQPAAAQVGTHEVEVVVRDPQGGVSRQRYSVVVTSEAINQPPTITSTPGFWADPTDGYQYQLAATDPDGDPLTYSLLESPNGMTVDANGLVQWLPTASQLGEQTVTVAAFDSLGLAATQTYTLHVTPANQAPVVRSTPIAAGTAQTSYRYDVWASDPEGESIAFSLVNAPEGMTVDELGRITWSPTPADIGTHPVEIAVTDSRGAATIQTYNLEVGADLDAPRVNLSVSGSQNDARFDIGNTVTLQAAATDNVGVEFLTLTVNGDPVALNAQGLAAVRLDTVGQIEAVATAIDAAGNVGTATQTLNVFDPNDTDAPFVELISLAGDTPFTTPITAPTDILGTVTDDNLVSYTLSVAPVDGGDFVEIASGTNPVTDGFLGDFDPSMLQNDSYFLRLSATDATGLTAYDETIVDVTGDLKLGNFQLSFTDLSIPVSGIPIQVTRTYDTLTSNATDDFGYGWRLEFRDTDLRTSLGKDEELEALGIASKGFSQGERVYITLPGGKREAFTFKPKVKPISRFFPPIGGADTNLYTPAFESEVGSTSTLTVKSVDLIRTETGEFSSLNGGRYNPANSLYGFGGYYELTTKEGIVYRIDGMTGDVTTVTDRNGNTLTFTDAGITSSTGQNVTFERNPQGQITAVIDPEGNRVTYEYDAAGDLVSVTDRENNVTQFDYKTDRPHYLEEITDPLGRSGVRSEYDDTGRLHKIIDADGNPVELTYDPDNSIQQVTNQLGHVTTYEYDERGNVLTEIDPEGGVTRREYNDPNHPTLETRMAVKTRDGEQVTEYTYDSDGNLLTETDSLGNVTRYTYDRFGNVLTTTDPTGQTITNTYDAKGNLTQISGQASGPLTFDYDAAGNLKTMTDGVGTTTFEYDAFGNIERQTDALGHVTTFTYDGNGNRTTETTTQTLADGTVRTLVTRTDYDDEGRAIKVTDAKGGVTQTIYDAAGNRVEEIDALGRKAKFVYDERGQLIATVYPDNTPDTDEDNPRTQTEYDAAGQVTAEIDELRRQTTFEYDKAGRQTATIFPDDTPDDDDDNPRTETVYDEAGRVLAEIDERGNRTAFVYDEVGRVVETILPDDTPGDDTDNPRTSTTYDAAGRQLTQTDALGQTTTSRYDQLGRPVGQEYADGTSTAVEFDDAGRVKKRIDQNGVATEYEYDDLGRLTAVIDALGHRTAYTYDEQGNLMTQTDANGNATQYEYDGLGRRTATELPLGQRSSTVYDAVGNALSSTDFNGETIAYGYDERGRLVSKDLPGDEFDEAFTYTDNGLRETVTDGRGTTTYRYDERSRLLERIDPDGRSISYTYDAAGNRTTVEIPSGTTTYTYDAQNRLKTVTEENSELNTPNSEPHTSYTYNAVGNLVRTDFANGTVETREYDELNRLVYLENSGAGGVINSFRYTLDETGNRTAVEEHDGRRVEYSYDDLYRLTKETIFAPGATQATRTIEYAYDDVGNRLSREDSGEGVTLYTYDDNDRLLTATTDGVETSYSYDDNGNTVSKTTGSETVSYQWNAENRLIGADTNGDGTVDVTNQYDADGIRVSQTVGGEETRFLIDGNRPYAQVVEEYTPGGVIKVSYVHGRDLISQERNGEKSFYRMDGLGSTRGLSDESGGGSDKYIYDAFGGVLTRVGETENSYLFAGEQRDGNTGLDYLRARYLDVETGRFYGRDPFEGFLKQPITLNKYPYGNANPVTNIDPSGLFSLIEVGQTALLAHLSPFGLLLTGTLIDAVGGGQPVEWEAKITLFDLLSNGTVSTTQVGGFSSVVLEAETKKAVKAGGVNGKFKGIWTIGLIEGGFSVGTSTIESRGDLTTPSIFLSHESTALFSFFGPATFWDVSMGSQSITAAFIGFGSGSFSGTFEQGVQVGATLATGFSLPLLK